MCKELGLSWQDSKTRKWLPIARISKRDDGYFFRYTNGAIEAKKYGFNMLPGFPNFEKAYCSSEIFPVFQNRIMNKSRPDRKVFLDWINLNDESYSPFEELARTGGIKATDNLQLYPIPVSKDGLYTLSFFVHGVSHLPQSYKKRTLKLEPEDALFLMKDVQNKIDPAALALRTEDPIELVGYVPKFFAGDFEKLFNHNKEHFHVVVERLNSAAPEQLRLLCKLSTPWPRDFKALNMPSFTPLINI